MRVIQYVCTHSCSYVTTSFKKNDNSLLIYLVRMTYYLVHTLYLEQTTHSSISYTCTSKYFIWPGYTVSSEYLPPPPFRLKFTIY